ncbi:restriction endonuclease [Frankia sp. AgB1.9]|uniref:restriction endonuclease n=1 Tax=unclassified Frankia TaxID=2632575 RepID=UPI0019345986|nr:MULTISPECIES: restriction endonuclease [unclassified Frankia]MBL7487518.1 restriction endonuclease [Frankia sp. AgW1.1]MBL7547481.1 restriction endonuclease [Frankia sp. AgB1.9]MBL7618744.1 restriction endonuclease [Frankia sp. AgB1.8]
MTTSEVGVPTYDQLLWPSVRALRSLSDSGAISELNAKVIELEGFSSAQQEVLHGDGPQTQIIYRLGWARTYLKLMGVATNSSRGVWTLTDLGRSVTAAQIPGLHQTARINAASSRAAKAVKRVRAGVTTSQRADAGEAEIVGDASSNWKEVLLDALLDMKPDAFERLAQLLLREAGFLDISVTGKSGDGGIDGVGVYRLALVSFPVFFQCKRYRSSVGAPAVRDFRGAMAGQGDKGLLITTGTFTSDAKKEATKPGAPVIDLIDGDTLCDLLKEYKLGLDVEMVEQVTVNPGFFADI